jgi:hypothetical protein
MEMPRNFTSIQSGNKYCCSERKREGEREEEKRERKRNV